MLTFMALAAEAQFIPYSQFQATPLLTNPGLAGISDHVQVTFQYRQSKASDYEIPSISLLYPLLGKSRQHKRYGGFGVTVVNQSAGPVNLFKTTGVLGGYAHVLHLSRLHHISLGIQGGVVNKRIDATKVTTDSQYSQGGFDPSLPHGEDLANAAVTRPVFNAGAVWYITNRHQEQKAFLGASFYNMNRPSYDLLSSGGSREEFNYVISGEAEVWKQGAISLSPSFRYILSKTSSLANAGLSLQYALAHHQKIGTGAWYKTNKAIVSNISYDHGRYFISAAYEFSTTTNLEVNLNNAFEIALGVRMKRK